MPVLRRREIAEALRHRLHRSLRSGALQPGQRLPSTRTVAADLDADPRVVAAAYRELEAEGLVELRHRAGVFVARDAATGRQAAAAPTWAVEAAMSALAHGVPLPKVPTQLRALSAARGIRAVVAASTADQVDGLVRELREEFGLVTSGVLIDAVSRIDRWPRALSRADLVLTTAAHAERLRRFHRGPTRPLVVAGVRRDLMTPEWRLLASGAAYVIVADPRFGSMVRQFLASGGVEERVTVRIAGRDSLHDIASDVPTYVTEAARNVIGHTRLPGALIPRARLLDEVSARAIVEFIVRRNAP